jgi:hypothetical protein
MVWSDELLATLEQAPDDVSRFEAQLDAEWIENALQQTGTASLRKRRLPAEQVLWLVLGMALYRDRSIVEVAASLDIAWPGSRGVTVAPSAIPKARQRLGSQPLKWLFEHSARVWSRRVEGEYLWKALRLYAIDGSQLRLEDTPNNRETFGGQTHSTHPNARIVVLLGAQSRMIAAARVGAYAVGEQSLARDLWDEVPACSLVLVDRAYNNTAVLVPFSSSNDRHWLMRAKSTSQWVVKRELGPDDFLVEIETSSRARAADPSLPRHFEARVIGYQHTGHTKQFLITSMTDEARFCAKSIIEVYHSRWEIENAYDEMKTELLAREETLRSRSADGVYQEIWGLLLMYNLIRLEMTRIAQEADVAPNRISFITALNFIRNEWMWCAVASPGAIPKHLRRLRDNVARFVLPPRRQRFYPRVVKSRGLKYDRKKVVAK